MFELNKGMFSYTKGVLFYFSFSFSPPEILSLINQQKTLYKSILTLAIKVIGSGTSLAKQFILFLSQSNNIIKKKKITGEN